MATPASLTSTVSGRPEHFSFLVRQASQARAVIGLFPSVVEGPASLELMVLGFDILVFVVAPLDSLLVFKI
jgi:hypothetical protein